MKDCRLCSNWVDENLDDITVPVEGDQTPHLFFGCKIYGNIEDWQTRADTCPEYRESADLYATCTSCRVVVPKVCISMGVCVNCLNTDLFCVEQCIGGELNKYCQHFVRLQQEGVQLISNNMVFDLFPDAPKPPATLEFEKEEERSEAEDDQTPPGGTEGPPGGAHGSK